MGICVDKNIEFLIGIPTRPVYDAHLVVISYKIAIRDHFLHPDYPQFLHCISL